MLPSSDMSNKMRKRSVWKRADPAGYSSTEVEQMAESVTGVWSAGENKTLSMVSQSLF